jgi:hypothetical protein
MDDIGDGGRDRIEERLDDGLAGWLGCLRCLKLGWVGHARLDAVDPLLKHIL